jgi:hypothetical protein
MRYEHFYNKACCIDRHMVDPIEPTSLMQQAVEQAPAATDGIQVYPVHRKVNWRHNEI